MEQKIGSTSLLRKILKIGLPIAMQNFVLTSLNLVDNIMIGSRGEVALAAVSLSNRLYFFFIITIFGVLSGMGIFTSQYWGVKDKENIIKIIGMGFLVCFSIAAVFAIIAFTFPSQILSLFSSDLELLAKGTTYLKIVCFSYIPLALSYVYIYNSRSIHRTKLPMVVSIIALSINTLLNYILINGKLGFPVLGVKGAAIATLIARCIEMIILFTIIYRSKNHPLRGTLNQYFSFSSTLFKKVMKKAIPVILNEASWSLGMAIYFIAYGALGVAAIASIQVALTISDLFWAFLIGFGNAISVIVGNHLGAREIDKAKHIAKVAMLYNFIGTLILSGIYLLTGRFVASIFNFDQKTIQDSINTIIVSASFMCVRSMNFLLIVGILRSGGDTKFCLVIDFLSIYLIGVPLAFFSVHVLKLPVHLCLAVVYTEEIVKFIIVYIRYKSDKWINVLI
ncbi:MAG: MATE family efflux transporter [Clostridiales bacterium]|nr:MATE family efflux transporter [Clostridiales bacterium]